MDITNKVILRLNPEAMDALFPQGTQARVDLQASVLTEASKRFVKGQLTDDIKRHLDTLVTGIANKVDFEAIVAGMFSKKPGWNQVLEVKPNTGMQKAIADQVALQFQGSISEMIEREVEARLPKAIEGIEGRIQRIVDEKVAIITHESMRKKVNEAFAAAGLRPLT